MDPSSDVPRLVQNRVFEVLARAGYVMNGLLHLIIGYLAIRIAFRTGQNDADPSGALATVAAQRGGDVVLWIAAAAFLFMGLWRLAETALGRSTDPKAQGAVAEASDRGKALSLAVVYFAFAYSAFGFARGAGESSARQNATMSARLMQSALGTVALVIAGIVIVVVGVYHVHKGVTRSFLDDLTRRSGDLIIRLGVLGYVAKGLTIAGAGALVILAVFRSKPAEATGLDGALETLGAQPYGVVLLVLAALTYGFYSFVMARYTKM
jgi:type IV secretory pathway VirB2 component (pilin)